VEEFLEGGEIEDFVVDGLRSVDDELDHRLADIQRFFQELNTPSS
jgi:hypothetical protein